MDAILNGDNFDEIYRPMQNHLNPDAPFDGTMYETYGAELDHVLSFANDLKRAQRVWTIVDGDDGELYLVTGYHLVNRLGYIITDVEWTNENESFQYESGE